MIDDERGGPAGMAPAFAYVPHRTGRLVECTDCRFSFHEKHTRGDGEFRYTCPRCAFDLQAIRLVKLSKALQRILSASVLSGDLEIDTETALGLYGWEPEKDGRR